MIVVRILGRIVIRIFGGLWRFARRHEGMVGLVIVLAVIGGVGAALVSSFVAVPNLLGTQSAASAATPTVAATATVSATATPVIATPVTTTQRDAPANTEAFMHAEHDFDAAALWKTLSPDFQQSLTANNQGQDYFAQQFAQQKQSGLVMTGYQYVAGQPVANGQSFHFYIATFKDTQGKETPVPFSFHLDAKNLILNTSIG